MEQPEDSGGNWASMTGASATVLMAVRNGLPYLERALASISRQSWTDWEALIVDDGSTDDSPRAVERWRCRDSRFVLYRRPPEGLVAALNAGVRAAQGRVIVRMDADDVMSRWRLERTVPVLQSQSESVLLGTGVYPFPRRSVAEGMRHYVEWLNGQTSDSVMRRNMFIECVIAHPTLTARRETLLALGGYRDRGWPEDYDLVLRHYERGGRFAKVPEPLLMWRVHPAKRSWTHPSYCHDSFLELKFHFLERTLLRDRREVAVLGGGPTGRWWTARLLRAGVAVRAVYDLDPNRIGARLYGAPILHFMELARGDHPYLVGAVGLRGARGAIVRVLEHKGFQAIEDYVFVA